jgi:hypothetical protein
LLIIKLRVPTHLHLQALRKSFLALFTSLLWITPEAVMLRGVPAYILFSRSRCGSLRTVSR